MYLIFPSISVANEIIQLDITGIKDKALLKNINQHLSQIDEEEIEASERYKHLVSQIVDKALRSKGYYNSKFTFIPKNKRNLILDIKLNKPVRLNKTDIKILGDAKQDTDFKLLLKTNIPAKGSILNHKTYDNFKTDIEKLSLTKGYFDSDWLYHRLEVSPSEHIANWKLGFDSGKRYHYGKIIFKKNQIHPDYLQNILNIKSGKAYLISDLSKLASDLSSTKWFSSAIIEPEIVESSKLVNLHIKTVPEKRNLVEIGIGYETNVGPHLQLGWKKPWLNKRGHSIESRAYISKSKQSMELGYKIPLRKKPLGHYYQISTNLERESLNDIRYTRNTLELQRFWNNSKKWSYSIGLKSSYDSFYQGNEKFKTLLIYPTISINRLRSDGKKFPNTGDSQKIIINYGNEFWKSDIEFFSIRATTAWIETLALNHRFYFKGEFGYLHTNDFNRLPTSLRFFAGGDNSIRGFGYKQISSKDSKTNKLTGASRLATFTAEYQYQFYSNWWGATFYDVGLASHSFNKKDIHSGAGIGLRWASPIGAIKFDIASPIKQPNDNKSIHFYVGLGTEL